MPHFRYVAKNPSGNTVSNTAQAPSASELTKILRIRGLTIETVEEIQEVNEQQENLDLDSMNADQDKDGQLLNKFMFWGMAAFMTILFLNVWYSSVSSFDTDGNWANFLGFFVVFPVIVVVMGVYHKHDPKMLSVIASGGCFYTYMGMNLTTFIVHSDSYFLQALLGVLIGGLFVLGLIMIVTHYTSSSTRSTLHLESALTGIDHLENDVMDHISTQNSNFFMQSHSTEDLEQIKNKFQSRMNFSNKRDVKKVELLADYMKKLVEFERSKSAYASLGKERMLEDGRLKIEAMEMRVEMERLNKELLSLQSPTPQDRPSAEDKVRKGYELQNLIIGEEEKIQNRLRERYDELVKDGRSGDEAMREVNRLEQVLRNVGFE